MSPSHNYRETVQSKTIPKYLLKFKDFSWLKAPWDLVNYFGSNGKNVEIRHRKSVKQKRPDQQDKIPQGGYQAG
jgi:hypothetical protein